MVEIALEHEELLDEIRDTEMSFGRGAFWWLGQHTYIVKAGGVTLYLDPWFADWESRQTRAILRGEADHAVDIALISHGHGDHLCPETLAALGGRAPNALFVCPRTERHRLIDEAGIADTRIRPLSAGESVEIGGVRITAIKSKHEFFDEDPELGFPYLGYVVEVGGVTFYHAGDTIMYDGLIAHLQQWPKFDAMFLPINGRDAERYLNNCLGNFTFQEAAELAGEFRPGVAVPAHWDMFIGNQEDPTKFVRFLNAKFPGVRSWVGMAGERVLFP